MKTLLVGFDSAWTRRKSGALVGALQNDNGVQSFGDPEIATFQEAEKLIRKWQGLHHPESTIIMLDQPTIVKTKDCQRPVENIVSSPVCRRGGGVQPAYTNKHEMFGEGAPVWGFLEKFGGPIDPIKAGERCGVFETYPVLTMIALRWEITDSSRPTNRLPKYNPQNTRNFSIADWQHVCRKVGSALDPDIMPLSKWAKSLAEEPKPIKCQQDKLDACLCLLVALHYAKNKPCLMVGKRRNGYIVVPHETNGSLYQELELRCQATDRSPSEWLRVFHR